MEIQLFIDNSEGDTAYEAVVVDEIEWTTERVGVPGKLSFSIIQDEVLQMEEGNAVRVAADGEPIFFGYIFTIKRDKNKKVSITAYDQLRYLNNKDSCLYENETASSLIKKIAEDYQLKIGTIEDIEFILPQKSETNISLFDIIQNALDQTLMSKGVMYCLYDDCGKLNLKRLEDWTVPLIIDQDTAQDFDYTSSIDTDTYNQIKLTYDNGETGTREMYLAKHSENIQKWGVLQYYDTIEEQENGQAKADKLLELYNTKLRSIKIKGAFGDFKVRAGTSVVVSLDFIDTKLENYMLCEKVTHKFSNCQHTMDLTLKGRGDFFG